MIQKTLGIDLGTNSLGLAVRNMDLGGNIIDQLDFYSSTIFKSGVGNGKSGEYSFAAERTKFRSTRRLYQARKYRIWATLRLLIAHGCCPLTDEQLDRWEKYDKKKGLKRQYPVDATVFEQWVRLDFDCDGKPEYTSPYQLRAELTERQLDWDNQTDRYRFGRAMYHIAQRRGFKSSKGETLKDVNGDDDVSSIDISAEMKKSEEKKSKNLSEYMELHHRPTVGCAFYQMERDGIRVRNSEYQAVQSQYQKEVKHICEFQHIDTIAPALYTGLTSTKQGEGTIFYRRPLRSQKGNVGKCTLEPNHRRCPQSHPDFEEFRALSFINNIKYRIAPTEEWHPLTDDERTELFEKEFTRSKATFKFADIRKWIESKYSGISFNYDNRTINYRDHTTVAGCPVISRLRKILGDDWRTATIPSTKTRVNHKTGEVHSVSYNYEDLWHLAYSSDDYEQLSEFAKTQMHLDDKQVGELTRLWSAIQEGYTTLSLKAVRNILPLLRQGLIYSEAVALAKIPDIIGHGRWESAKETLLSEYTLLTAQANRTRLVYNIANTLISHYKSRTIDEQQGFRDTHYNLDNTDRNEVNKCIISTLSEKRWNSMPAEDRHRLQLDVEQLYQQFFASTKRDYYKVPRSGDTLKQRLAALFPDIPSQDWDHLYHHSQIDKFPQQRDSTGTPLLGTPDIGSIKNPVALRALHVLRRSVNGLLQEGLIDENTRVVVETARELNDANWRWAIESYQKMYENENRAIAEIIKEFRPNYNDDDIEKGRLLFEQNIMVQGSSRKEKEKAESFALDMQKYKLWKEQKFQCLYTGEFINVKDLFDNNITQIEHTVPRSISFDNSLTNKTVCFTQANREKNNRIPSELPNYGEIQDRIKPWMEYLNHTKAQIELWKGKSRTAATVERKNTCIRQKHLWEMERDYWQAKVRTFTIQKNELDQGFVNSQLVDTRIITKYAFHYLKSVFSRVDVEKGSVTADFRKILGIQSADEKKDRSKHSHHAIDAAVLTMIPVAAQRDRMIKLFYQCEEANGWERDLLRAKLDKEIAACHIGSINGLVETIESNILINHISKDQTLSPAKKPRYVNNKRQAGQWNQGDSIRGSLHKDTFYGAIQSSDGEQMMVVRKPLNTLTEKDLETIVDATLRNAIRTQVDNYMASEGISFSKAIEKSIYMLNKNGETVLSDKNGRPIAPIRHVRCYAKAGRGFLKKDTALQIKQQTYPSKQEYKNSYYVQNDDNYLCLFYDGMSKGKQKREFRLINYFEIVQLGISNSDQLFFEPEFAFYEGNKSMHLKAIIKKGTRVLLYSNRIEEVQDLDNDGLSKHLYIVYKFNSMGTPTIYLRHHLEARKESDCNASETDTCYHPEKPASYLSLKASNFQALIEHYHFDVDILGNIQFK